MCWRRISAAAPATRTSSRRFAPPRPRCGHLRRVAAPRPRRHARSKDKFVGRSVPRLEDRPLLPGQGRFAADVSFPGSAAHAGGALDPRARQAPVDRCRGRAGHAGRACGVDRRGCGRHSADRLSPDQDRRAGRLPPARAGAAAGCAMSASRSRWCSPTIPISPRTPPTWSRSRSRSCRRCCDADAGARRVRAGPLDRGGRRPQGIRRRRRGVPQRPCDGRARAARRPPFRRAAGDPRRDRPLRRRARRAGAARRRQGAALEPRPDRPHARAARRRGCISTRAMSAAASASAASFIPRTCWSARRRCGSAGR